MDPAATLRKRINDHRESPKPSHVRKHISPTDLENILQDTAVFMAAIQPLSLSTTLTEEINTQPSSRKLLLVLVHLEIQDQFPKFLWAFKDVRKTGNDLPLSIENAKLVFHEINDDPVRSFLDAQHRIFPQKLGRDRHEIPKLDQHEALPFSDFKEIGKGSFGVVYKVVVHRDCLFGPDGELNSKDKTCALKILNASGKDDSDHEVETLRLIAQSNTSHNHVLKFISAFRDSNLQLNILLDYMECGNLEQFLMAGKNSVPGDYVLGPSPAYEVYRSSNIPEVRKKHAILVQSQHVAHALEFLHNHLLEDGNRIEVVHLDLKPDNILIKASPDPANQPVGIWCLADFGVSRANQLREDAYTKRSSSLLTIASRPRYGPYFAPEVMGNVSLIGWPCDVWSMCCIFIEVAVFVVGGAAKLDQFRRSRSTDPTDSTNYGFCSISTMQVRPSVLEYLNSMEQEGTDTSKTWAACLNYLAHKFLRPKYDKRGPISTLVEDIRHMATHYSETFVQGHQKGPAELSCPRHKSGLRLPPPHPDIGVLPDDPSSGSVPAADRTILGRMRRKQSHKADPFKIFGKPKSGFLSFESDPFLDVALNASAKMCVWLTHDRKLKAVEVEWTEAGKFNFHRGRYQIFQLPVANDIDWQDLTVDGDYITAKTRPKRSSSDMKAFWVCRYPKLAQNLLPGPIPEHTRDIRITSTGLALFWSRDSLILRRLSASDEQNQTNTCEVDPKYPTHVFDEAVFSRDGRNLYAWSWGNGYDLLYAWAVDDRNTSLTERSLRRCHISNDGQRPKIRLWPFPQGLGCVIRIGDKWLVPQPDRDRIKVPHEMQAVNGPVEQVYVSGQGCCFLTLNTKGQLSEHLIADQPIPHLIPPFSPDTTIETAVRNVTKNSPALAVRDAAGRSPVIAIACKSGQMVAFD